MVPKSLTPVTSALEKFLLREEDVDEEEKKCDPHHEGIPSSGRPSNGLYIPKSASAQAALSLEGREKGGEEESVQSDNHPRSGLEKY